MDENELRENAKKLQEESNRMIKRFIIWGTVKLLILSAITAGFVYWYMYA